MSLGYLGLIFGAVFAGLVYVIIAIVVKAVGVKWIDKLMPPIVIGPTVAIIGLSLAGNAVGDVVGGVGNAVDDVVNGGRTAGGTAYGGVTGTPRTNTAIRNR